jgi:hypothetical protein
MKITETSLPGVLLITPVIYRDSRGAFHETFNQRRMAEAGLGEEWPQDNCSISSKNVLRGIHYQIIQPQGKLVRVTQGAALRRRSAAMLQCGSTAKRARLSGFRRVSVTHFLPLPTWSVFLTR